jgi:pimeloyl-ACP methyl ester carboxylesterase
MKTPETRYTLSGDVNVAYQVVGEGPLDLVFIPSLTHHIELAWENPPQAQFFKRLASIGRLLLFDKRGTGMSDRVVGATLEERMDDIRAVMDAAGSEQAALVGLGEGAPIGALFAATYPERTTALTLINTAPRATRSPELPWLPTRAEREREIEAMASAWSDPQAVADQFGIGSPSATDEERQGFARVIRLSVSPGSAAAYLRMNMDVDISEVLPLIRVPTLVMQRKDLGVVDMRSAHYLAEHIPGARMVELPGRDFAPQIGDTDRLLAELQSFLEDVVEGEGWEAETDRILATVLFTDIVDSTARAAELGDRAWRELLQKHHEAVRSQLGRFRGKEMDTAGDGFSPPSTARPGRSAAPLRSRRPSATSTWKSAPGCTPASASWSRARPAASPSTSEPALHRSPSPARCSCRARSRTSSQGQGSSSKTEASSGSKGFPSPGACLRWFLNRK